LTGSGRWIPLGGVKNDANFLSKAERSELLKIARDGLEEHRVARRANALLLLDKGWLYATVSEALLIDDSTLRLWRKAFAEGGVDNLIMFDLKGGFCALAAAQIEELREWATQILPRTTAEVGVFVKENFGVDYGRSGLIKLLARIDFVWRKPEAVPAKSNAQAQRAFIERHEDLRNSLGLDEAIVYADAVHPTHQVQYAGQWQPRDARCAIPANSGRKRLNLHGAIDLETGMTRIVEAVMVDAMSTIALFGALERAYPAMRRIHVFLDNARYHKAVMVRQWLARPGCRIVPHFVPPYCPHLNPIERLWGVMHRQVTRNTRYETIGEFADAILTFLRVQVPKRFDEFAQTITDNFRVIDPTDFRIVA
jgi:transposase